MEINALSPYKFLTSFEAIDEFTKLLGGFHDLDTALECLHQSVQKIEPDEDEKLILRSLEQTWAERKDALLVKIYEELQKISATGRTVEAPLEWPVM